MLKKSKGALTLVMVVIMATAIYMRWPKNKEIPVSPEVEVAINSIDPIPNTIPVDLNDNYHKITLGDWSHLNMECAFPRRMDDRHVSRNNLKTKTTVLKRADDILAR